MAANDGPVPVRTLAQAARLIREARQLPRYGIASSEPTLDYPRLLARVREVTEAAREQTLLRDDLEQAGVQIYEQAGPARFADAHTVESDNAPRLQAGKVIICTGGTSRPLPVPGSDLTATHSDAWNLSSVPSSLLVLGAGATGVQVASIFNAFGSRVHLVEVAPASWRAKTMRVCRGRRCRLDRVRHPCRRGRRDDRRASSAAPTGVRLLHSPGTGQQASTPRWLWSRSDGWLPPPGWPSTAPACGRTGAGTWRLTRSCGRARRTSSPPVTSPGARWSCMRRSGRRWWPRPMPSSERHAVLPEQVSPIGSFTDPEYASVGLTETAARQTHDVAISTVRFDSLPRPIIDGRPTGFCKLVIDRELHTILGCHVVGERAVELAQLAATAMAARMPVEQLALIPFSFPTYANTLGRAAILAAIDLDPDRNVGGRSPRDGS